MTTDPSEERPMSKQVTDMLARIEAQEAADAEEAGLSVDALREKLQAEAAEAEAKAARDAAKTAMQARLPKNLQDKALTNYTPLTESQKTAKDRCFNWVVNYAETREGGLGMVITGPPGCGKTHLASSIVRALTVERVPATFTDLTDFLMELRASFDGVAPQLTLKDAIMAPVLVVDDFGAQRDTEWAMETTYVLLNSRLVHGRPTIITTNLTVDTMRKRSGGTIEGDETQALLERRIYSRLFEITDNDFVDISGDDYRVK